MVIGRILHLGGILSVSLGVVIHSLRLWTRHAVLSGHALLLLIKLLGRIYVSVLLPELRIRRRLIRSAIGRRIIDLLRSYRGRLLELLLQDRSEDGSSLGLRI